MNLINMIFLILAYFIGGVFLIGSLFVFYNIFRDTNKVKVKKLTKVEKVEAAVKAEEENPSFFRSHNIDLGISSDTDSGSVLPIKVINSADIENPELRPEKRKAPIPMRPMKNKNSTEEQKNANARYNFPI